MINDLIVTTLASGIEDLMGSESSYTDNKLQAVLERPLRGVDPNRSIAIVEGDIIPLELEIGQLDPTQFRYTIEIQIMAKHGDKEEAARVHRVLGKRLRIALFKTTSSLRSALLTLADTDDGVDERVIQYRLSRIQPGRGTIEKQFAYFSVMTLLFETQSIYG